MKSIAKIMNKILLFFYQTSQTNENNIISDSLLNIVNDKNEFKKELSEKIKSLEVGETLRVSVSGSIRLIKKVTEKTAKVLPTS